jgi:hypothetical protein
MSQKFSSDRLSARTIAGMRLSLISEMVLTPEAHKNGMEQAAVGN